MDPPFLPRRLVIGVTKMIGLCQVIHCILQCATNSMPCSSAHFLDKATDDDLGNGEFAIRNAGEDCGGQRDQIENGFERVLNPVGWAAR